MKRLYLLLPLLSVLLCSVQAHAAKPPEQRFVQAKAAFERQVGLTTPQRNHRDRWQAVTSRLADFATAYPSHPRAPEASFLAACSQEQLYRISRLRDDAREAAESLVQSANAFPRGPFAAEALSKAASLYQAPLNDSATAYRLYAKILDHYPQAKTAGTAQKQLKALAAFAPSSPTATATAASEQRDPVLTTKEGQKSRGVLNRIRSWSSPGYTRVVLDLSRETSYKAALLSADQATGAPPRLYLDLDDTTPLGTLPETSLVNDGMLQQIRTGRPVPGRTRVVLDLSRLYVYKIFTLPEPFRVIIDINDTKSQPVAARVAPPQPVGKIETQPAIAPLAGPPPAPNPPQPASVTAITPIPQPAATPPEPRQQSAQEGADQPALTPPQGSDKIAEILQDTPKDPLAQELPPSTSATVRRIVIDPGHGGKDPGAIGRSGLMEKTVTLNMAKLLAEEISKELGWEVILTREDDTFIPLEERTAIANKVGADLFLSIHANASPNRNVQGIETYYLNFSKNEKAAAVAARENGTSLQQLGALEQILFDLMAHSKIQESSRLASDIQTSLVATMERRYGAVKNLGVKQGPFYVLLGANMPSVLVETAFISNKAEESRLASRQYQTQAVKAILSGIRAYAGNVRMVAKQ